MKHYCRACSEIRPPSTGWAIQMDRPKQKAVCLVGVDFAEKYLPVEASSSHGQSDLVRILKMGPRKRVTRSCRSIYSVVVVFVQKRIRIKAS